jgi:hypothetical protein
MREKYKQGLDTFNMTALYREAEVHGDILFVDLHDTYRKLSLKMLAGFHWLSSHCDMQRVKHVLKVDTDTFVNVDLLLQTLERLSRSSPLMENALMGEVLCTEYVHPHDTDIYPFHTYPPYLRGPSYVLPGRVVNHVANASLYLPLLEMEDSYFTGVIPRVLGLQLVHLPGILPSHVCQMSPCYFLSTKTLTTTSLTASLLGEIWRAVEGGTQYCHGITSLWVQACSLVNHAKQILVS